MLMFSNCSNWREIQIDDPFVLKYFTLNLSESASDRSFSLYDKEA